MRRPEKPFLPDREGVYLVETFHGPEEHEEVDVYRHSVKGLCCFSEDIGSSGGNYDDKTDCHVSVQFTGLKFIRYIRPLGSPR